jgi:Flp pilus assembly protein TadD
MTAESAYEEFQRGIALFENGSVHAAIEPLMRARDLEPQKSSIREYLARALYRTGRFAEAADEFRGVIELDPVNDYAHFGLGKCALQTGDLDTARRNLRLAVAMRPDLQYYGDALADALARGGSAQPDPPGR